MPNFNTPSCMAVSFPSSAAPFPSITANSASTSFCNPWSRPCRPTFRIFLGRLHRLSEEVKLSSGSCCHVCPLGWWGLCCQRTRKTFSSIVANACRRSKDRRADQTVSHWTSHLSLLIPWLDRLGLKLDPRRQMSCSNVVFKPMELDYCTQIIHTRIKSAMLLIINFAPKYFV